MYHANEIPGICGTLFYYGSQCPDFTPRELRNRLTESGFFPADYVRSPTLTKGRLNKYSEKLCLSIEDTFENPKADYLSLMGAQSIGSQSFWEVSWHPVKPGVLSESTDHIWSILSIRASYDKMRDPLFCERYLSCFQSLIELLHPFYATIDDIDLRVQLSTNCYGSIVPMAYGKLRYICWGNYFGPDYCKSYNIKAKLPTLMKKKYAPYFAKEIADGIFITLTDSPMDYDSEECRKKRYKLMDCIGL